MAENASLLRVQAGLSSVVILARESFVQVETFLSLGATFHQVEFAQFHDLWGLGIVRVHAVAGALEKDK